MYILWCSVLYKYIEHIYLTMHMHACIHDMENVSFNIQTLTFFNCHIWASTKLLCTRVWRTLVGKPNEKNDCLFTISPDSQVESLANEMSSYWHSTAYAIEQRENVRYEIVSTHSNVQCGWNTVKCILYIDSRATNNQCSIFSRHACSVAELLQSDTVLTPSLQ